MFDQLHQHLLRPVVGQIGRCRLNGITLLAEHIQLKPQHLQVRQQLLQQQEIRCRQLQHLRKQTLLPRHPARRQRLRILVEQHPLMRPLLVDEHQPALHRGDDITPLHLEITRRHRSSRHLRLLHPRKQRLHRFRLLLHPVEQGIPTRRRLFLPVLPARHPRMFEIRILRRHPGGVVERIIPRVISDAGHKRRLRLRPRLHIIRLPLRVEIQRGGQIQLPQRLPDARQEDLKKVRFVLKLNLRFRRVDIHVHHRRIHRQVEKIRRYAVRSDKPFVGFQHRLVEERVLHEAVVHEKILLPVGLARILRRRDEPLDTHQTGVAFHRNQPPVRRLAENMDDALPQPRCRQVVQLRPVVLQRKGNLRVGQRHPQELVRHIPQLRGIRLQKLPPRGYIVKQILHRDIRPLRRARLLLALQLGRRHAEHRSQLLPLPPRAQLHLRHGSNRRQRLPPESQRMDMEQILRRSNLGCGMPLERHPRIRRRHPLPVVNHLNRSLPHILQHHPDMPRPRIHGILHQLLHHGSRTLDHLSRRNLIRHRIGQQTHYIRHRPLIYKPNRRNSPSGFFTNR